MTIKTFEIDWENRKETISYDDDIKFGELENILNKCLDMTKVNEPKVNIPLYRQLIVTAVLTKAPFPIQEVTEIRNLKTSVAKAIMKGVMRDYPLMKYLEEWVETFVGEEAIQDMPHLSTTSSLENSVGQKNK
jgi:hypothetical protein